MERDTKVAYSITEVNNMVVTYAICGVFTTISVIFNSRLLLGVPLYRSPAQHMDNAGLIYSCSHICHEVCINKSKYQYWCYYMRLAQMRYVFKFYIIKVAPVPFNSLKLIISENLYIELE